MGFCEIAVEEAVRLKEKGVASEGVVEKEQPQLVLMGKQTIDSDNNQTGQMLGALTGMAQGTFASEVVVDGDSVNVTREIDGGLRTVGLKLPAIVTTDLGVEMKSTLSLVKVTPPAERSAGIKVADVAEL